MGNEEIKLPDLKQVEFLSKACWPPPRWFDPVPWWVKVDLRKLILQAQMRHRVEIIRLEVQAKEIEGKMLKEIEEILGRQK